MKLHYRIPIIVLGIGVTLLSGRSYALELVTPNLASLESLTHVPSWVTKHSQTFADATMSLEDTPSARGDALEALRVLVGKNHEGFDLLNRYFALPEKIRADLLGFEGFKKLYQGLDLAVCLNVPNAFITNLARHAVRALYCRFQTNPDKVDAFLKTTEVTRCITNSHLLQCIMHDLEPLILQRRLYPPVRIQHNGKMINSAQFNHDGTRIVTAADDKNVCVWDAHTGALLNTLIGHTRWVNSATFNHDSTRIVTASDDRTACIWDAENGTELHTLVGHADRVKSAQFDHSGSRVVTVSGLLDMTIRLWDAATGEPLRTLAGHSNSVNSVQFSPDDVYIVTASHDGTARIWDASTGDLLHTLAGPADGVLDIFDRDTNRWLRTKTGHNPVISAQFNQDGSRVYVISQGGTIFTFDTTTGTLLAPQIVLHSELISVQSAQFSPDGTRIAASGTGYFSISNKAICIFNAKTGALVYDFPDNVGYSNSSSVQFSPDGARLAAAPIAGAVCIWHLKPFACSLQQALLIRQILRQTSQPGVVFDLSLPQNRSLLPLFETLDAAWKNALLPYVKLPLLEETAVSPSAQPASSMSEASGFSLRRAATIGGSAAALALLGYGLWKYVHAQHASKS